MVMWQGLDMVGQGYGWCGCTGGRYAWGSGGSKAQRDGRQREGWLLFDAALLWLSLAGLVYQNVIWYHVDVV